MPTTDELIIFELTGRESECGECKRPLGKGNFLRKEGEKGLCLDCADLGHLVFLGAGDACVTRRAKKYSPLAVVVLRFSRSRKRYERQGLLLASDAIDRAESECLGDAEARARKQQAAALRRSKVDAAYVKAFAAEVRRRYPSAPADAENVIAEHACRIHSGRIGRTAQAKDFDPTAIDLAVQAHVRHGYTRYDELLGAGGDRQEARRSVRSDIDTILDHWRRET
jgi:hypothetical protein